MRRLIGDSRPSELYSVEIDQQEAVWWSKILLDKGVPVVFTGRYTRRRWGKAFRNRIELNVPGQNLGTLVHELAHLGHSGHQNGYKVYHRQLLDEAESLWYAAQERLAR